MCLTSSWNIETHFWHRIWNIQNESVQNIYTFDYLTLLDKKLQVFKKICDTFCSYFANVILVERYIYIYLSGKIANVRKLRYSTTERWICVRGFAKGLYLLREKSKHSKTMCFWRALDLNLPNPVSKLCFGVL